MSKDLFVDLANAADDIIAELDRIQSGLQLLEEGLSDEVQFLDRSEDDYAKHFACRYDLYRGLLEMTMISLYDYRKEFSDRYNELWEAYKAQPQAT